MARQVVCSQCRAQTLRRVMPHSWWESAAWWLACVPMACQECSSRTVVWRIGVNLGTYPLDRREHLRIPVRLYLSFSGGKIRGEGMMLDLSMGGCVIQSDTPVHLDDIFYLQVSLTGEEAPLELAAIVRSVTARGIAFKFLRQSQDNKRLQSFLHTRAGGGPTVFSTAA